MRSSLIAVTVSAVIAGIFALLTEPVVGANDGLPKSAASSIPKPAVKGDRLDLNPAGSCLFSPKSVGESNNCAIRPAQPALRPSHELTVIVSLWPIELAPPLVIADTKIIG